MNSYVGTYTYIKSSFSKLYMNWTAYNKIPLLNKIEIELMLTVKGSNKAICQCAEYELKGLLQ